MSTFVKELIMLSDILDVKGFRREAEEVDFIIKHAGEHAQAVKDFVEDLKASLTNAAQAQDLFPTINEKSIVEVFHLIDQQLEHGSYLQPAMSRDTLDKIQDRTFQLAAGIAELERSVKELRQKADETPDSHEKQLLITDLSKDFNKLQQLYNEVDTIKNGARPGDQEMYNRFLYHYNKAKGGISE